MKLAVSNIAWDESELASHLTLLKDLNCDGVELAPSCIWGEPTTATQNERVRIKNLIADEIQDKPIGVLPSGRYFRFKTQQRKGYGNRLR